MTYFIKPFHLFLIIKDNFGKFLLIKIITIKGWDKDRLVFDGYIILAPFFDKVSIYLIGAD